MNNLKILLGVAISLSLFSIVSIYAQEGVNVTSTNGTRTEVPTLEEQIQTSLTAWTGIALTIMTIIGFAIKAGVFDRIANRKKLEAGYATTQQAFMNTKAIMEDKALMKQVIGDIVLQVPEDKRAKYTDVLMNLDDQINAKNKQLQFYYEKAKQFVPAGQEAKINPDLCPELPREGHNMSQDMHSSIPKRIGEKNV